MRVNNQVCLYPNVYLMDQFSSQIRTYRPLSVDKTEVTIYCIAPKGESAEARARRIRQYEDFFNASGMATPDDLEEFRSCQIGMNGRAARVERHVPRRHALDQGAGRGRERDRPDPLMSGVQDRGRGTVHRPAPILARGHEEAVAAEERRPCLTARPFEPIADGPCLSPEQ